VGQCVYAARAVSKARSVDRSLGCRADARGHVGVMGERKLMATTTKKDLIDRLTLASKTKRTVAKKVVQGFLDLIIDELERGNRIEFRNFGIFEVRVRAPRTAQNPKTLERVQVPARRTVKFKAGRDLKARAERRPLTLTDATPELRIKTKRPTRAAV
jgi:integration host factor subunit beta